MRTSSRTIRGWRWAAVVALLASGCGDAARERVLVVYSSLPEELLAYTEEAYEAVRTDVDVRIVALSTDEALARLSSGQGPGDVWWGPSGLTLAAAADEELLEPYRPVWLREPGVGELDPEGRWQVSLVSPFVIAFNREKVELTRAPTDWVDLFHARWRGEIQILDPTSSDEMATFLGSMIVEALRKDDDLQGGFDWLLRLDAATEQYPTELDGLVRRLASGDALITVLPRHTAEEARHDGAEWLYYRLPESGTPMLTRGIAVIAGASEPELARDFIDFTGSIDIKTAAKLYTRWMPSHGDIDVSRMPDDFEIDQGWMPYLPAVDTLAAELEGWLDRWRNDVRGRGKDFY